jgi:hypothetical protein
MRSFALLATLGCLGALLLAATPASARVFVDSCGNALVRPKTIVFTCADAGLFIESIHWRTWGGPVATGDGLVQANTCDPFCAAGHFRSYPARVQLRHRERCGRGLRYRLITLTGGSVPPSIRHSYSSGGC